MPAIRLTIVACGRMLFSIDHVRVPHLERLAEQRADPTPMLYTQMPKLGPSLCTLWMSPKKLPETALKG